MTATDTTTTTDTAAAETFPNEIVRGQEVGHEGIFRSMEEYENICLSCWGDEVRRELEDEYECDDDERRDLDKDPIEDEEVFERITTTQEGSRTFDIWELDAENSARVRVVDDTQAVYRNDRRDYLVVGIYESGELYDIDIFYDEEDLNDYIEGLEDATVATSRNYRVLREGDRYTICETKNGMPVVNDGVCLYYYWSSEDLAQEAADAYNAYEGKEWLGQHGYGNDRMTETEAAETESSNPDMVRLYRLFGAIDYDGEEEEGGDENL